jgi:small-conductance mechanosensitive channel
MIRGQDRNPNERLEPWQPRFSIATMLLTMLVFAVMASAGGYLVRALREGDRRYQLIFILMTLAAPMLLMVVVSLVRALVAFRRR